jgi:hypothetical protein
VSKTSDLPKEKRISKQYGPRLGNQREISKNIFFSPASYTLNLALLPRSFAWLIQLSLLQIPLFKVIIN